MNIRLVLILAWLLWPNVSLADSADDKVLEGAGLTLPALEADANEEAEYAAWSQALWESLTLQTGAIVVSDINVALNVPDSFYYLDPADTEKVLVEVWGNPPGTGTLGMLLPTGMTPFDDNVWAVTIEYIEDGYVSDQDAGAIDYQALLGLMQQATQSDNEQRAVEELEPLSLLGWAVQPNYDATSKKMYWAQELKFGNEAVNVLNYNIRVLGRKGVLLLNFIAGMDQRDVVAAQLETVLNIAEFSAGARYVDFNPGSDPVADYGLSALVTGNILTETHSSSEIFALLKQSWLFIVIGLSALLVLFFLMRRKR